MLARVHWTLIGRLRSVNDSLLHRCQSGLLNVDFVESSPEQRDLRTRSTRPDPEHVWVEIPSSRSNFGRQHCMPHSLHRSDFAHRCLPAPRRKMRARAVACLRIAVPRDGRSFLPKFLLSGEDPRKQGCADCCAEPCNQCVGC